MAIVGGAAPFGGVGDAALAAPGGGGVGTGGESGLPARPVVGRFLAIGDAQEPASGHVVEGGGFRVGT